MSGFDVAKANVVEIADINVLLIERYDRALNDDGQIVRLHQEDFAQALGLPASLKYERDGAQNRKFDAQSIGRVLAALSDPAGERDKFVKLVLFDLFTGNVDAHAKNHALMHLNGLIATTPRYDLLPTRLSDDFTDDLSFKIGSATTTEAISHDDFSEFLSIIGIEAPAARERTLVSHATELGAILSGQLSSLSKSGMKPFADLIAQNLRTLLPIIGLKVPELAAGTRRLFYARRWLAN